MCVLGAVSLFLACRLRSLARNASSCSSAKRITRKTSYLLAVGLKSGFSPAILRRYLQVRARAVLCVQGVQKVTHFFRKCQNQGNAIGPKPLAEFWGFVISRSLNYAKGSYFWTTLYRCASQCVRYNAASDRKMYRGDKTCAWMGG